MEDRVWMYTGRPSQAGMTSEWINKTDAFLEMAFGEAARSEYDSLPMQQVCKQEKIK
jgi:hypothetical protein